MTISSGSRRVDLALPGSIPVAELVPELARAVGLLDASTVHGGYRLVTQGGRILLNDAGLTTQGIEDGGLLTITAGVDEKAPRVYDDIAEAMADVVENDFRAWEPAAGRRTALGAGAILLGLGALAFVLQGDDLLGGVAAAVIAGLLVAGGVVLAEEQSEAGVAGCHLGALYAGVAGLLLAPGELPAWSWTLADGFFTEPLLHAGLGVLGAGLVAVVGLRDGRPAMIPVVVVGAVVVAGSVLIRVAPLEPGQVLTVLMTLVVLVGSVFPWLAPGLGATSVGQLHSLHDITADPEEIDPDTVAEDARVGHEILLAVSATVGILLVLLAPFAVDRGGPGTVLAATCCLAVMLRTRQYRTGAEVLAGLTSGVLGLVSVAVSMLLLHDGWRTGAAIGLAGLGAAVIARTLLPASASVRRDRLGDVAETLTLLALLPLMVLAAGFVSTLAG